MLVTAKVHCSCSCYMKRPSAVVHVLVDGAYSGAPFERHVKEILGATVEVAKRSELHKFAVIPELHQLPGISGEALDKLVEVMATLFHSPS
jgi:transposase